MFLPLLYQKVTKTKNKMFQKVQTKFVLDQTTVSIFFYKLFRLGSSGFDIIVLFVTFRFFRLADYTIYTAHLVHYTTLHKTFFLKVQTLFVLKLLRVSIFLKVDQNRSNQTFSQQNLVIKASVELQFKHAVLKGFASQQIKTKIFGPTY